MKATSALLVALLSSQGVVAANATDMEAWISLDVAPDGRSIVFDLRGDLYTIPIEGGQATRIAAGPAFDSQPRYSPDGRSLVFVSDRDGSSNVWVADLNGQGARQISQEVRDLFLSPEWTRDGRSIVVSRAIGAADAGAWQASNDIPLYLYALRGGAGLPVSGAPFDTISGASSSGGGRYLGAAFGPGGELFVAVNRGGALDGAWQVASFDAETARPRIRTVATGSAMRPMISPDGRHLVYATRIDQRTQLCIEDLATGTSRTLVDEVASDSQGSDGGIAKGDLMPGSAFMPDGTALVASYGGKIWRVDVSSGRASLIPFTVADDPKPVNAGRAAHSQVKSAMRGNVEIPDLEGQQLPLKATRTVRFFTDEGTWISLDVAPDGKTIVFELLGDLYTVPISGGDAKRITHGMAFDSQPRYSPDGKELVFVSDRNGAENLWIANADGSHPRALTSSKLDMFMSPEWAPDGAAVVVTESVGGSGAWAWGRNARLSLHQYPRDGSPGFELDVKGPQDVPGKRASGLSGYTGAAFGADSRTLFAAFTRSVDEAGDGTWQIASIDRDTGSSLIRTAEPGGAMRPMISPDGRNLVYTTRHDGTTDLRIHNLESGDTHTLLANVTRDAQRDNDIGRDLMPGGAFMPDGSAVITSYAGKLWRIEVPGGRATSIPFVAEVRQGLGALLRFDGKIDDKRVKVRQIRDARPSPDGQRLAFSALDRLWVMTLPDGKPHRLTQGEIGEFFPVWSPDGRYLVYATWSERAGGSIQRVRSDGGEGPRALVRDPAYYYDKLAYSPTGRAVFAARSPHQARAQTFGEESMWRSYSPLMLNTELIRVPAEGGDVEPVMLMTAGKSATPTFYAAPHFSKRISSMVLYEYDGGLVSLGEDYKSRQSLLQATGWGVAGGAHREQEPADDIVISPDGTRALVLMHQDLYLIDLPSITPARTPTVSVDDGLSPPLPLRRITRVGKGAPAADFPGWMPDGSGVYFSLGTTFFTYDLNSGRTRAVNVDLSVPRDTPSGSLLLRGARLLTMKGSEIIENGELLVVNNRIRAVGRSGELVMPPNARVMDVSGKTIMPGLIDVHAHHWTLWGAHMAQPWEYQTSLAFGVTSMRDPQPRHSDVLTYGDRLDAGDMLGPRIFSTGRGVFSEVGLQNLDDARQVLRRYSEYFRTHTVKQYLIGGRQERQWFAMAAREQELTPTTEGGEDLKMNLTLVLDGYSGLEHAINTTPLYRDVTELMARSGIAYTLTMEASQRSFTYFESRFPIHDDAKLRRFAPHAALDRLMLRAHSISEGDPKLIAARAADAAKIVASRGRVALGTHGELPGLGAHWELWATQSGGMPPYEALRVATLFSAEAIGLGSQLGSLEPGKLADLLVLDGNPVSDIHESRSIRFVMRNGRLYEGDSLDEVWPRRRSFDPHAAGTE